MKKKLRLLERIIKFYLIENNFAKRKKFLTRMTPINEVKQLIELLYPINCEKGLTRLGPEKDGGYLVPDDLDGIEACFSPGVSNVSGFEKDCANRNIKVFLADASVNAPTETDSLFDFIPMFIGSMNNDSYLTLDKWVNSKIPDTSKELLLQMDIERAEYEVFHSLSEKTINRFRIMVIEFHDLDEIWNYPFFKVMSRVFKKILQTHHCVHIHPNNIANKSKLNGIETVQAMEFTFYKKERINKVRYQTSFPHKLDRDNSPKEPTVVLPISWYKN
tara:strand:+ start:79 stop:903 length:825 start_codon:yes stop_codon:yes gene_type:complete